MLKQLLLINNNKLFLTSSQILINYKRKENIRNIDITLVRNANIKGI